MAELVPYGDTRIVLRHNDSVVLYDTASRRVVARNVNDNLDPDALDFGQCPTCGRPYSYAHQDDPLASSEHTAKGDASPEYFRVLAGSLPNAPPSPVRQLAQAPLRSSTHSSTDASPSGRHPAASAGRTTRAPSTDYFPDPVGASTQIDPNAFSQGYFSQFFKTLRELGRGGKGVVFLAKHVIDRVDLGSYAVKRIPVGNDHRWLMKIMTEVQLLSKLHHDNLVQYKHVWLEDVTITNFGPSVPCAFVLQEYCNAGDLHRFICGDGEGEIDSKEAIKEQHRRKNSAMPEDLAETSKGLRRLSLDEIYSFFKQITAGVNYLHENNYVHRDLKPSNCLLHDTGQELRVLVSDFGEVQIGDQVREGTGATGTISYCAPEVLRIDPHTSALGAFTCKSDVFSLGMVLHFLCFGQLPYHSADGIDEEDEDFEQLKDEISRWAGFEEERHLRSDLPDVLYQNLSWLLSTNPGHRPSTSEILAGLESRGVSGRINGSRPGSNAGKNPTNTKARFSSGHLDTRRASRNGAVPMERNRSPGSVGANSMSSSILTHSTASTRRHVSPPTVTRESTGETAVATEPDSDMSDDGVSSSFRRDSVILRPSKPVLRAGSPHRDGQLLSPAPSSPMAPPSPRRKLLTASEHDFTLERRVGNPSWRHGIDYSVASLSSQAWPLIKLVFFVVKLLSLYVPCLPAAADPHAAAALLCLALVDFVVPPSLDSLFLTLMLAVLHAILWQNGHSWGIDICLLPHEQHRWWNDWDWNRKSRWV